MKFKTILLLSVILAHFTCQASPRVVTDNISGNSAVLDLDTVNAGCELHFGVYGLVAVSHNENAPNTAIIKLANYPDSSISLETNFEKLDVVSRNAAEKLLKIDEIYTVRFSTCGNSTAPSLIDLYKQSF